MKVSKVVLFERRIVVDSANSHKGVQHCPAAVALDWVVSQRTRHIVDTFKRRVEAAKRHNTARRLYPRRRPNVPRLPQAITALHTVKVPARHLIGRASRLAY